MSLSGCEALAEEIAEKVVIWGEDDEGTEVPMGFDVNILADLLDEHIARHVAEARAAALNEATEALDAQHLRWQPIADARLAQADLGYADGRLIGTSDTFWTAARIVRNLANPQTPAAASSAIAPG